MPGHADAGWSHELGTAVCLCGEQKNDSEVVSTPLGVSCADLQHSFRGGQASSARRDAGSAQCQHLPVLGAGGDVQPGLAMYGGHLCDPSKNGIGVAHHHLQKGASLMPRRPLAG